MGIGRVLQPGMWVMRKMRFATKLGIVFLLALLPMPVLVWQLVDRNLIETDTTHGEVRGVHVIDQATEVIRLLQAHRGQTNLVLSGNREAQTGRDQTRQKLAASQVALVQGLDAELGERAPGEWRDLRGRLNALVNQLDGKDAPQAFAMHSALIEDLTRLVYGVAEKTGLLYDPDPQTYLLMDMSVSRLIPLREAIGRLRGAGAGFLSQAQVSDAAVSRVGMLADNLNALSRDVQYSQRILGSQGFKDASGDEVLKAIASFTTLTKDRFKLGAPGGNADAYFAAGTQAVDAVAAYHKAVNRGMVDLLDARVASLRQALYALTVGGVIVVLALMYLILSFNLSFLGDLREVLRYLRETAGGNLRHKMHMDGVDEISDMARSLGAMVQNISGMVASVRSNAALVANSGDVLVDGNSNLSSRTEQQAANLEQTSASVQELASTVRDNATAAQESDRAAQLVRQTADQGSAGMQQAIASVEAIEASTRRMDEIVGVIDGLAFQTNILALNAAVEAARAGDSGRGFAVVATEVRSLAKRSADSAKEIRQLITTSSEQVATGVGEIRAASKKIADIANGVRSVASNMSLISASSAEQSASLSEITTAIRQLDQITQQNASMVEQSVNQATALQSRAGLLADAVSVFQLQQGSADEARALVDRALELRRRCGSTEAFVREVTPQQSGLFDRDMYVFVLDSSGQYLAFGGNPAKVGTRVQDVPGIDGDALMESIMTQAEACPGWVEYDINNPLTGRVQTKMSFVQKMDDLYLGCGVYKNLMVTV